MTATPRKISEMPPATVIADADLLPIVDVSESSVSSKNKKVTVGQILASLPDGAITSGKIADGAIVDADVNAAAAIADTKLATIATAGKVSNSATTATNANTASAIVARDSSGNFSAGTITAALAGNASTVTTNANLTGDVTSVGNATSIAAGVVVDADVNASAGIVASKLSFTQAGTGAVARTVDSKLKDTVSVKDFGAVGDGVADDTAAIQAALAASNTVFFPAGTYLTSGNHNIKAKSLYGVSQERSIIKLSGANTNTSLLVNGESISTAWGSGGGCVLQSLGFQGNWNGSTTNTETNISNIGALLKWWSGSYVRVNDCNFQNSFGFGIFCYRLGYSYFNGCHVNTNAKNGIHLAGPNGSDSITSTSINFCSIHSCRGRSVDATTGGNAIYVANGFAVSIYGCVVEDVDDGFRLDGSDNRSVSLYYLHAEQCSSYDVYYAGTGTDFGLYQCILGSTNKLYQPLSEFQQYTAINNFGLQDTYELPIVKTLTNQVLIDSATPRITIASVTVGPGTWQLTGTWIGVNSANNGTVSNAQAYAINTSAAIPGYSNNFQTALFNGELISPVNTFNCLSGSLSLLITVTASTTFYLYGGPASITGALIAALSGQLCAVKVNGPYL